THWRARGHPLSAGLPAAFLLRRHATLVDPLDAVRALLHHPTLAHRDVRVGEQRQDRALLVGVPLVEIEAPHLVGAVVRAVLRADAAVVRHLVEALGAVRRRGHGADDLAGSLLAVHAEDRLVVDGRVFRRALVVAVDADPVHFASAADLVLPDDRD